jgi:serine/threonine protein kinase/tetratricopeptide (TPR) repeat protein
MAIQPLDEEAIFQLARKIESPEVREGYLEQVCGDNPPLRARVQALLGVQEQEKDFLRAPAAEIVVTVDDPITERPGTVIGAYKLMEQIGEGGMGLVFVAEQHHPVRRKVALKVIKPGMDTRQVVARFEAERQALALMDHPNIAKVLDGGETTSGRPYFVMELVKGVPITEHCDQNQVAVRERLELFLSVCQAVQHAHQKGIIHRDIKPSNVLIMSQDGTPLVKVIDFGIAKAIGQQLTEKTIYTQFNQLVGTPLYMSPEQAGQSSLDVDTRSDIYSLGVLLYELLTGTTPFDQERLKEVSFDEMRRIIREEEPPRPSTRISTMGQAATTASTQRQSDPRRLSQLFRGELDWVVMKALEKDRNRRYETASAFAADVQRYLHDEPVLAHPPSSWYRVRKLVRRHKTGLAVAGGLFVVSALLLGATAWTVHQQSLRRAGTERAVSEALEQAEMHLGQVYEQIENPVRLNEAVGLAVSGVERAEQLLATGEGTEELTLRVRQVREVVDAARADSRVLTEIETIQLEKTASVAKGGFFEFARAAPLYAEVLRRYGIDPASPQDAAARVRHSRLRVALLMTLDDWRRDTTDKAEKQRLEALLELAEPAPDAFRKRWRTAVRRGDRAALIQLVGEPEVKGLTPIAACNLAWDLRSVKELVAAERLLKAFQERYPWHFWLNQMLGENLLTQRPPRPVEAVRYLTAAVALRSTCPGAHENLGIALHHMNDREGAIRELQIVLQLDPNSGPAHDNLGNILFEKQDKAGAIREYQTALRINPDDYHAHCGLGMILKAENDPEGAIREFQTGMKISPNRPEAHYNLGIVFSSKQDLDRAIREYQAAIAIDPDEADAHYSLGNALRAKKDFEGAVGEYKAAIALDPEMAEPHCNLGFALQGLGRFTEALATLKTGHRLGSQRAGWPYPSRDWVRDAEGLVQLDVKLSKVLRGEYRPDETAERLQLAWLCQQSCKQLTVAAARFFSEAFATEPKRADDLRTGHRYDAACVAALAGCAQGKDAGNLGPDERAHWRGQALEWLQADLRAWRALLEKAPGKAAPTVLQKMEHWQRDVDLAGVRGPEALARLPQAERTRWQKLWEEVVALKQHADSAASGVNRQKK